MRRTLVSGSEEGGLYVCGRLIKERKKWGTEG